jgi:cytidylate kinase
MIITISGTVGSGKSTAGKLLAKTLNYQYYSAGDVKRKFAVSQGMSIEELNKVAETDPTSDLMVDEYMKKMNDSAENMVVDARIGFFFLPKSIKVFIDADHAVRAERIMGHNRSEESYDNISELSKAMEKRQKSDIARYSKLYNINPYEHAHYDLVVDSTKKSAEEVAGEIYRFIMFRINRLNNNKNKK